ncbi:hypothetical protein MRB53_027632 [Persea americana]|uniref:Uncharacterized protein n=1 Tax=Persea americana TaxID=3435 RepID=A0ACC2LMN2_PERAE|nr:hypothetical protein MRB53_027632 [Persea americana]
MRNSYAFASIPIYPQAVVSKTKLAIFEWSAAKLYISSDSVAGLIHNKWFPPTKGFYKLNFDGAMNPGTMTTGIGGIIRNHNGELIVAYTSSIKAMTPLEAEIQALYQGIIQCKVNHARRVIIEGDCLVLIENVQN